MSRRHGSDRWTPWPTSASSSGSQGGVAAYKSAELVRRLREQEVEVRVVMTRSASAFIGPLTLEALSGERVYCELFAVAR